MSENIKKIKISRELADALEARETELRDLINGPGFVPPSARLTLDVIQDALANCEVEETWTDDNGPKDAA